MTHFTDACRIEKIKDGQFTAERLSFSDEESLIDVVYLCSGYPKEEWIRESGNSTPIEEWIRGPPSRPSRSPYDDGIPPSGPGGDHEDPSGPLPQIDDGASCAGIGETIYIAVDLEKRSRALSLIRRFDNMNIENILMIGHLLNPGNASRVRNMPVALGSSKGIDKDVALPNEKEVYSRFVDLCKYANANPDNLDRVELAAAFAYGFCMVHPFVDGNGRTSRMLANYFLKEGESFAQLPTDRQDYRQACLGINFTGDLGHMYEFFNERLKTDSNTRISS